MKIAIATIKKDENSEISPRAGRAPYYLIFNEKEEVVEEIRNPFAVGSGGAGFAVAKMLADKKVEIVVAGDFGPNMVSALKERGLKFHEKQGIAKEVLQEFITIE